MTSAIKAFYQLSQSLLYLTTHLSNYSTAGHRHSGIRHRNPEP
jgi:hypothetical protein